MQAEEFFGKHCWEDKKKYSEIHRNREEIGVGCYRREIENNRLSRFGHVKRLNSRKIRKSVLVTIINVQGS